MGKKSLIFFVFLSLIWCISACSFLNPEPNLQIKASKTDLYIDKGDEVILSINSNSVLNGYDKNDINYYIVGENSVNGLIAGNKFTANKEGKVLIKGKIDDLISENTLEINVKYSQEYLDASEDDVKDNLNELLDGNLILGYAYSIGLNAKYVDNYELTGAEGVLKLTEEGLLEICGIGYGTLKLTNTATNKVICENYYNVYNSILATNIKNDLISKGIIENKSDIVTISMLENITTMDLSGVIINDPNCIYGLKYLKNIYKLDLSGNDIDNIEFAKEINGLKELNVSNNNISDISSIVNHQKLEYLDLSNNKVEKINKLQQLHYIEYLDLSNNRIKDISYLSSVYSLTSLLLNDNKISNFTDSLSGLDNLKELGIGNCGLLFTDIISLSYIYDLTYLDISGTDCNMDSVSKFTNLQTLIMSKCNLFSKDISAFNKLTKLKELDISNNGLSNDYFAENIDGSKLINLETLKIGANEFTYMPDFSKFTNVDIIDLTNSYNMQDISNVSLLKANTLILDDCELIDSSMINLILTNENILKLSTLGGFSYLTKESYELLLNAVKENDLTWRFIDEIWYDKNSASKIPSTIYFSLQDFLNEGCIENEDGTYSIQNISSTIVVSLLNDVYNDEHINISISRNVSKVYLFGNKLQKYNISFNIEDRKESSISFELYNMNLSLSEGVEKNVFDAYVGSKLYINACIGDNSITGSKGIVERVSIDEDTGSIITEASSAINAYDVRINTAGNSTLAITGGEGGKGPDHLDGHSWVGQNGGNGANAINCNNIEIRSDNVTVKGGNGGKGGATYNTIFTQHKTGAGGNGGHGICYSGNVIYNNITIAGGLAGELGEAHGSGKYYPANAYDGLAIYKNN